MPKTDKYPTTNYPGIVILLPRDQAAVLVASVYTDHPVHTDHYGFEVKNPDVKSIRVCLHAARQAIPHQFEDGICWIPKKSLYSGGMCTISYEPESWEERARRLWHESG